MHALLMAVRLFPYWGLVVALTFLEIGLYYRRRGNSLKMGFCAIASAVFLALVVLWFVKRGDLNSAAWVRAWVGS